MKPTTAQVREQIELIRHLLTSELPDPKKWAKDILEAAAEGRGLRFANRVTGDLDPIGPQPVNGRQIEMAREALE